MKSLISIVCMVVAITLTDVTYALELAATVTVDISQLQMDDKVDVRTMEADVREYLNNQRYSRQDWEGPRIPVSVGIFLTGKQANVYTARLTIVSTRLLADDSSRGTPLLRVYDADWQFQYSFSPALSFQSMRYDEFTSLLDFYMLIAIGLDMDTYSDLGGDNCFIDAKQIAQLGNAKGISQFSSTYEPGHFTRMALISELTDPRYQQLRRYFYDYHLAVDEFAVTPEKGRTLMVQAINDIDDFRRNSISNRSVLLQSFFNAKAGELAEMFKGIKNSPVWQVLMSLDPSNTQLYESARSGR